MAARRRHIKRGSKTTYWFWLRRAVGPAKCLAIGLVINALGFVGIGWAYDVGLLFAATAVLFIAAPANLQYLYINGVVLPEKQGRLSGGIQIVGAVAAALGLALGYSLWLGLKTSAERGTRRTKRDWAVRRGVPEVFADSSLDTSIARRHAIAAASSQCLIRAGTSASARRAPARTPARCVGGPSRTCSASSSPDLLITIIIVIVVGVQRLLYIYEVPP